MSRQEKTCLQCGDTFFGRSNQLYCSKECKQEAFYERQEERNDDEPHNTVHEADSERQSLALEVEMRRLEYEHERRMYELQSNEKQLKLEKEIAQLKTELEKLRMPPTTELEPEKPIPEIPAKIQKEVYEALKEWLEHQGEDWHHDELKQARANSNGLRNRLLAWARKHKFYSTELEEIPLLESISDDCQRYLDYIRKYRTGFFDDKACEVNSSDELITQLTLYLDEFEDDEEEDFEDSD